MVLGLQELPCLSRRAAEKTRDVLKFKYTHPQHDPLTVIVLFLYFERYIPVIAYYGYDES